MESEATGLVDMETEPWAILLTLAGCVIGAYGALYLKKGSSNLSRNLIKSLLNRDLIFGVLLFGISTIMFIIALTSGELSVLYPMVGTTYVWVALLSTKYLNEKMNLNKWAGIAAIVIGISLVGIGM